MKHLKPFKNPSFGSALLPFFFKDPIPLRTTTCLWCIFFLKKTSALQVSARGQPAPISRQTRIQWKLKEACSFPPSPSETGGEGGSTSPCFVWILSPPPFLQYTSPFVILRSIIAQRKSEIKTCWWLGMTIYYLLEYKRLIARPHPHAVPVKSRLCCRCSHGSILDRQQLPPKSSPSYSHHASSTLESQKNRAFT